MGVSKFPRHHYYQTFGMSQRISSIGSTESDNEVDQWNDDECGAPLEVSDGRSSPALSLAQNGSALPNDSHLGGNESSEENNERNISTKGGILLEQILLMPVWKLLLR